MRTRTQVGIVGAGPAGLVLAQLLDQAGIESVILENRSREYVTERVRAGVLEQGTADLLDSMGLGERMHRDGIVHHGLYLRFRRTSHRIPLSDLTGGRSIWIYGQQEVVKDLIEARLAAGQQLYFEVSDVSVHDFESEEPRIEFSHEGERHELQCDVIAGCDGFHGVCRPAIEKILKTYNHEHPFGWLGILAAVAPSTDELIYTNHERGFALHSLRSPELSRIYLQCDPHDDISNWSDDRIWEEMHTRFATNDDWTLNEGPVVEKLITPMKSFLVTPMQHGRVYLAGDAAHIVPATGAKGLNLAIHDVRILAEALTKWFKEDDESLLEAYSETCLRRVWRVQLGREALPLPGDARKDLDIIVAMARELGLDWHYSHPREVFDEMRKAMPSIAGITWERLERESGVTYPCEHEGDPGEPVVFIENFPTETGRAKLVPAQIIPAAEKPDREYPFVLITGRQLEHWHTGSMTRRSRALDAIEPFPVASINPADLAELGVAPGGAVTIASRRGEVSLYARADDGTPRGSVFIPFCYYEAAANLLTNPVLDPFGKIPEFKYCAVRVTAGGTPVATPGYREPETMAAD